MIEQLKTIQTGLAIAIDAEGFVDKPVRRALLDAVKAAAQLEAMVGEQEPIGEVVAIDSGDDEDGPHAIVALYGEVGLEAKLYTAAPVAQQPQEIEVQCPVCNHKFYEWPNDKQPQAEAVPTVQVVNCDTCKHSANSCDDYPCNRCGVEFGDGPFNRWEAPHQAEAVPLLTKDFPAVQQARAVVQRQADRYRDLMMDDAAPQEAEAVPPGFVAFARDVLADFPHGFPDGFDLNDLAIKHGLLIGKTVTERCGELCNCAEYHGEDELKGGVTCYHRHAAIAQQKGRP